MIIEIVFLLSGREIVYSKLGAHDWAGCDSTEERGNLGAGSTPFITSPRLYVLAVQVQNNSSFLTI